MAERQQDVLDTMRAGWVEQAKADQELDDHRGFDCNLKTAQRTLEHFGTPELTALLDESGLGDHPELIRFALRVGRRLGED